MKKKKVLKIIAILGVAGLLIGGGIGLYMFNKPHRDVQSANADYTLTASEIVSEYFTDKDAANKKYLAADGDSKILEITGVVSKISEDFSGQKVVLLKDEQVKAGVSASFTSETNSSLDDVQVNQKITIKGVIRSGASYDEDLEMYEHVIIEKSNIVLK
jgi:tRNA_anti-like